MRKLISSVLSFLASFPKFTGPRTIFASDLRALALFRMGLGVLVMVDTLMRGSDIAAHYADWGVLPSGVYINEFAHRLHWSLHLGNGSVGWQVALFTLTFLAGAMLFFGYKTRLATIACWILIVSVQNRNPMVLNGGDVLFRCLLFFAIFLPMQARYSVDRALATDEGPKTNEWFAAGSVAILLQVAMIYWSTVLLKTGKEWFPEGSASYFALSLDSFVTAFGAWMVQWTTLLKYSTWAVYFFEGAAPFLLFCPFYFGVVRTVVLIGLAVLHINFDLAMRLGLFPWIDVVALFALIPGVVFDKIEAWLKRPDLKDVKIFFDGDCGFCKKMALIVRQFFLSPEVSVSPSQEDEAANKAFKEHNSWVVRTPDGENHVNWGAAVAVLRHSPWFGWLGRILPLRKLDKIGDGGYWLIKKNRKHLGALSKRFLPYGETGTLEPWWLTNLLVLFMIGYVGLWNLKTIPDIDVDIVDPWTKIASVTRVDQKWNMFAPYPLKEDGWYVIEGKTRDGTPVDLMKGTLTPVTFDKPELAAYTFKNARWRKYLMNIWSKKRRAHRLYYGKYLCRSWNEATDDDDKKLTNFEIHFMKERTEMPGEPQPVQKVTIWSHDCFKKKEEATEKKAEPAPAATDVGPPAPEAASPEATPAAPAPAPAPAPSSEPEQSEDE